METQNTPTECPAAPAVPAVNGFDAPAAVNAAPVIFRTSKAVARAAFLALQPSMSTDELRFILNGVFCARKGNKVELVASDGRRLSLVSFPCHEGEPVDACGFIPAREVARLLKSELSAKSAKEKGALVSLAFENTGNGSTFKKGLFTCGAFQGFNDAEGNFPNHWQVIPKQGKGTAVDVRAFVHAAQDVETALTADDGRANALFDLILERDGVKKGSEIDIRFRPDAKRQLRQALKGLEQFANSLRFMKSEGTFIPAPTRFVCSPSTGFSVRVETVKPKGVEEAGFNPEYLTDLETGLEAFKKVTENKNQRPESGFMEDHKSPLRVDWQSKTEAGETSLITVIMPQRIS